MKLPPGFGARMRRLRQERGWTTTQLGDRADLADSTIAGLENGYHGVSRGALGDLARALGVTPSELWGMPVPRHSARRNVSEDTNNADYSADELEFMKAMDRYKRENRRPHPTWCEVLGVLRDLGYRKVT